MNEKSTDSSTTLRSLLRDTVADLGHALEHRKTWLRVEEVGTVVSVEDGVAEASGLSGVKSEELVIFSGKRLGMVFNVNPNKVGVVMLDDAGTLSAGSEVHRTNRVLEVPVGEALIGRTVDAMGRPLDDLGQIPARCFRAVEREAPGIMDRAPVESPLQTGIKVIDALVPVGRGQRELILGDRQTGKTAIGVGTIINQKGRGVICIYCAIGKQAASVAKIIDDLRHHGAMGFSILVVTTAEEQPGLQFVAPYAATTIGEYFMEQGMDVLIVYDDLTCHARAYRELSLLLRRPPGREAFPGDIFYIHSRLLERSTHLRQDLGGGSLTALPIAETEAQNIAGYIPTNLISITDGQIYLCPHLFQKGILPAVDVGKSVSRVGGKSQLNAYRSVAGDLRLSYSQFGELEGFARFGTRLDKETRKTLERGRRVREVLKQPQYELIPVPQQIAVLLAVSAGILDEVPMSSIPGAESAIRKAVAEELHLQWESILAGRDLTSADHEAICGVAARSIQSFKET